MQVLFSGRKVKVRNWLIVGKRNRYGEIILFNFLKLKAESKEEKLNQVGK